MNVRIGSAPPDVANIAAMPVAPSGAGAAALARTGADELRRTCVPKPTRVPAPPALAAAPVAFFALALPPLPKATTLLPLLPLLPLVALLPRLSFLAPRCGDAGGSPGPPVMASRMR